MKNGKNMRRFHCKYCDLIVVSNKNGVYTTKSMGRVKRMYCPTCQKETTFILNSSFHKFNLKSVFE